MIKEIMPFVKQILEEHPETRSDGYGLFLNKVTEKLFPKTPVDFTEFSVESYTRAKRKVLELNPSLDNRTQKTIDAEAAVRNEMS